MDVTSDLFRVASLGLRLKNLLDDLPLERHQRQAIRRDRQSVKERPTCRTEVCLITWHFTILAGAAPADTLSPYRCCWRQWRSSRCGCLRGPLAASTRSWRYPRSGRARREAASSAVTILLRRGTAFWEAELVGLSARFIQDTNALANWNGATFRASGTARDVGGQLAGRGDRINDVLECQLKGLDLVFERAEAVEEFELVGDG